MQIERDAEGKTVMKALNLIAIF